MDITEILEALKTKKIHPEDARKAISELKMRSQRYEVLDKVDEFAKNLSIEKKPLSSIPESLKPEQLGNPVFQKRYKCRLSYVTGSMYRAISSVKLVVAMGQTGLLSFFGSAGFRAEELKPLIQDIQTQLGPDKPYGMCLIYNFNNSEEEMAVADVFINNHVPVIEAAAYATITSPLVYCRAKGLRMEEGRIIVPRRIIAKCSRLESARLFLSPPPKELLEELVVLGRISFEEAELAKRLPIVDDIAVESDSGGHTDQGVAFSLVPAIVALKNELKKKYGYQEEILIGCGGGLGTPEAVASAFMLGADFIFTGSINQCTVQSGVPDVVKDILQSVTIHDTTITVSGEMFESGSKVQVVKKNTRFSFNANKLYQIYNQYHSLEDVPSIIRQDLEKNVFKRSLSEVWDLVVGYKMGTNPTQIELANKIPRKKMSLIFKWYFAHCSSLTLRGEVSEKDNFLIYCGPAMGSFNQWVKGTKYEHWKERHVNEIADLLMEKASEYLVLRLLKMSDVR